MNVQGCILGVFPQVGGDRCAFQAKSIRRFADKTTPWRGSVVLQKLCGVFAQEVQVDQTLPIGRIGNPESMDHPKNHSSLFGLGLPGFVFWRIAGEP